MKMKSVLLLSVLMVLAVILGACAPAATTPEEPATAVPEEPATAVPEEPVTINVFIEGVAEQRIIEEMLPEFDGAKIN